MNNLEIKKFKAWLNSPDSYERDIAISVFWHSGIRDDEIDHSVTHILRTDNEINIRRSAIKMLSGTKDGKFQEALIEALDDEDWQVKGEAFMGIMSINPDYQNLSRMAQFIDEETHPFCRWCIESAIN